MNEKSAALLESFRKQNGYSLNIFDDMSASPIPIRVYNQAQSLVFRDAILSGPEINLVQLAVSVENSCEFCVPAHTASAIRTHASDPKVVDEIRDSRKVFDLKIDALVNLARSMVHNRGKIPPEVTAEFYAQGYTKEHLFEVLTIVAYKTITNYTSAIMNTKPNPEHAEYRWKRSDEVTK